MRKLVLFFTCVMAISRVFSAGLTDQICGLYPDDVKPIVRTVLQQSLQQDKSNYGTSFPPNSQWLAVLRAIACGDCIANLGAGAPELSVLCALKGAKITMVDNRDDATALWTKRVQSIGTALGIPEQQEKLNAIFETNVSGLNIDCFEFLEQANESSYQQIICENLLHFFSDQQQLGVSENVYRALAPNGTFSVIVDRLPDTVENTTNANTFWVGRAVVDTGDGKPTPTQPMIYEPFTNPPFTEGLVREYQIQLSRTTPEVDKLFPIEKREEFIKIAADSLKEQDVEGLFGVSIEPRRLYTRTTIQDSTFATGLTLIGCSQLSGFAIEGSLLVGYAGDGSYFPGAHDMGPQKVAAVFCKS